jgi:hypothetical protein
MQEAEARFHSRNEEDAAATETRREASNDDGRDDRKIFRDFDRFGLSNATSIDAIEFIKNNLCETKKKTDDLEAFQEAVSLKKEDWLGPGADYRQSERTVGPKKTVKSGARDKKESGPRWNTGTIDFNKRFGLRREQEDDLMIGDEPLDSPIESHPEPS